MLIAFDQVPNWLLWSAAGFSALTWAVTVFLIGRRYWWICLFGPLFAGMLLFMRMGPDRQAAHGIVLYCVTMLPMSIGFLWQIRRLRAAYAEDPNRELGKLMTERQQLQYCAVVGATAVILYAAVAILCRGFLS